MAMETLADAASYHAHVLQKIVVRVTQAPAAAQTWRPAPGKWSILEHLEHVAMSDASILNFLEAMVNRAQARGLTGTAETPRVIDVVSALTAAGVARTPLVAPPEVEPTGAALETVVAMLQESGARHQALRSTLEQIDTDRLKTPLPVTGVPATLGQWYHFTGVHISRHDKHVEATLGAYAAAQA